jgi:hypothetical protein
VSVRGILPLPSRLSSGVSSEVGAVGYRWRHPALHRGPLIDHAVKGSSGGIYFDFVPVPLSELVGVVVSIKRQAVRAGDQGVVSVCWRLK